MPAVNTKEKAKDKAKGKEQEQPQPQEKAKEKAKGKEQEAGKQAFQCRCLCRHPSHRHPGTGHFKHMDTIAQWNARRCVFRDGHKHMEPLYGIGITHVCGEHLRIEIDGYRRDAGGKIMVPHTIVSKLRAPLDQTVCVTDWSESSWIHWNHWNHWNH